MIISYKSPNLTEFEKLSCGVVFRDRHSNICMKIEYKGDANMVYLCDGSLNYIDEEEKVEKVHCELVIENN